MESQGGPVAFATAHQILDGGARPSSNKTAAKAEQAKAAAGP